MNRSHLAAGALAGTFAVASIAFVALRRPHEVRNAPAAAHPSRIEIPRSAAPLAAFAAREERSLRPERRAAASRARMTLAYASAKRGDWTTARSGFERAAVAARDVPGMDPGFGTLADQARYQALVCLSHERPKAEAVAAFRRFIEERPESPLVHAAHRRLGKLRGGAPDPSDDALLQAAVTKQEARIRFETSVCGPKAVSEMLRRTGRKDPGYEEIAKLCGMTDSGTTMAGMRKGLKSLGIDAVGAELNRLDFARVPLPLLVLEQDHWVLVTARESRAMTVWDPRFGSETRRKLPPLDDREFRAVVLTTDLPPGDYATGTPPKAKDVFPKRRTVPKATVVDVPAAKPALAATTPKTGNDR